MNATQQLSVLISPIWVDSTQKPLYETQQNSTQVDLSLLKTWVAIFLHSNSTQLRKMAGEMNLLLLLNNNTRRRKGIKERTNPFEDYDDIDFKKRFRLSKKTVIKLLQEVIYYYPYTDDNNSQLSTASNYKLKAKMQLFYVVIVHNSGNDVWWRRPICQSKLPHRK